MKLVNIVIAVSFIWLVVSYWNRNELPRNVELLPELAGEPKQTSTSDRSFEAVYNDVEYLVEPQYEYDLYGMIVSYRHHDGNSRMHMQSNDFDVIGFDHPLQVGQLVYGDAKFRIHMTSGYFGIPPGHNMRI